MSDNCSTDDISDDHSSQIFYIFPETILGEKFPMQLFYTCNFLLPKLAWVAFVNLSEKTVVVEHGCCVECRENFFIEGVWSGEFEKGEFASTDCIFGTGGVVCGNQIVFVSSCSTTDYLYYKKTSERVFLSNSLPLLLASVRDSLIPSFMEYNRINDSIIKGIDCFLGEIPTLRGSVKRLLHRNFCVDKFGVKEIEKDMPPSFSCYEGYYTYLTSNYEQVVKNARSSTRQNKMEICSTQSKGYDSTAVNTIAAKFGIDKVFTILKGKNPKYLADNDKLFQVDDDGREICKFLGLIPISVERRAFENHCAKEYLFHAALHRNQDFNFMNFEKYIINVSILLTGNLGEIWATKESYNSKPEYINSDLKRWDLAGHGLSEWRLVVGFVQVPLPYIGARSREDILRITESQEMNPWRLRTSYDRPIPRRIAEEAGVPRKAFGQSKVASAVIFQIPCLPYGKELKEEFFEFLVREKLLTRLEIKMFPWVHYWNTAIDYRTTRYKWLYYLEHLLSKLKNQNFKFKHLWKHLKGAIFCFCVNKCIHEYEKKLKKDDSE